MSSTSSSPEHGTADTGAVGFSALRLSQPVLDGLSAVGYESPSPIQAACIPPLLEGRDLLGQAQTGTGKTAAFALPILSMLEVGQRRVQALVLAPTRELAIQVAEAFQRYASALPGFHVLPIYGGQGYGPQLGALKRGVHVVVGTPGRVVDHLRRGSLDLGGLRWLVLDEADEMLRMGFIDDVEAVIEKTPAERQVALFSATMPPQIRRIAQTHLREPAEITIAAKTTTAAGIRQRYWWVSGVHKLDALTRILETEPFEAMLVFARTRHATEELAQKLEARGFAASAIHGEVQQAQREKMVQRLRDGQLDILVATDVAARGLDVDRISHVLNYDIPYDTESYVHRIGRTGRAGRSGEAILFVAPRERGMLRAIERATRQPIEPMALPSAEAVNESRVARFAQRIGEALASGAHADYLDIVREYCERNDVPPLDIAAALAHLAQGEQPLLLPPDAPAPRADARADARGEDRRPDRKSDRTTGRKPERGTGRGPEYGRDPGPERAARPHRGQAGTPPPREDGAARERTPPRVERGRTEHGMAPPPAAGGRAPPRPTTGETAPARPPAGAPPHNEVVLESFRVEVGSTHGVQPSNLVGAIANEAGLDSRYIGRIEIGDEHSYVELPEGMPRELLQHLKKVRVGGRPLQISRAEDRAPGSARPRGRPPHAARGKPPKRPPRPR